MKKHVSFILIFFLLSTTVITGDLDIIKPKLLKLKELCSEGLLSEEECKSERAKILKAMESEKVEITLFCNYLGEKNPGTPIDFNKGKGFSESAAANQIAREILDAAGLVGNFIVRPANVPNAMASIRMPDRYIEYNPSFVQQLKIGTETNWAVYSVLAHEIGHHLQGHTLQSGGSRPNIEIEADEYSGFILAKMGATLVQSQKAMQAFGSEDGNETHPPKSQRLEAIKRGWQKGKNNEHVVSISGETDTSSQNKKPHAPITNPINQNQAPANAYLFKCVINGELVVIDQQNKVLSVPRNLAHVAQRTPPTNSNCAFNLLVPNYGYYCVGLNSYVYFGTSTPVGQCMQCGPGVC